MLHQCSKKYIIVLKSSKLNICDSYFAKMSLVAVGSKSIAFLVVVAQMVADNFMYYSSDFRGPLSFHNSLKNKRQTEFYFYLALCFADWTGQPFYHDTYIIY
jgi:hypothetical protein